MDAISSLDPFYPDPRSTPDPGAGISFQSVLDEVRRSGDPNIVPVNTPPRPEPPAQYTPDGHVLNGKAQKDMVKRGWTPEQIDRAVRYGERVAATNEKTGAPATRYVDLVTGRSVVIDNTTNRVLQFGESDFRHDSRGGDAPGATMRPAPNRGGGRPKHPAMPASSTGSFQHQRNRRCPKYLRSRQSELGHDDNGRSALGRETQ